MAILSTIKKVMPYLKTATGYVLCRLSSQAVEMDDGTTLQESYDSLNSKSLKLATFRETYTTNANAIRNIQLSKSDFEVADDTTFLAVWCECDTPNPSVYTASVSPNLALYVANSTGSGAHIPVNVFAIYQ